MTFIIILLAFIIERFFDWTHLRQWSWFAVYQTKILSRIKNPTAIKNLAAIVLPLALGVGFVNVLLTDVLYGFLKLIFGILLLVYCLGLHNFWAEVYKSIAALHRSDSETAIAEIQKEFQIVFPHEPQAFHRAFTEALFLEAHKRVFAVIFWFILLGPMGAVLYRSLDLVQKASNLASGLALQFQGLLDWMPARVYTFLFALGGHFKNVICILRENLKADPHQNQALISQAGIAALDVMIDKRLPEDGSAEKEALALLDRVFVMGLVFLAFFVLIVYTRV
jgi:AmpE protein